MLASSSRRGAATAALVVLTLVLAACSDSAPTPGPTGSVSATPPAAPETAAAPEGGVFFSYTRRPTSIDPGKAVEAEDLAIVSQLFDSLTATDADLNVVPAVAERWESNEDSTVFTFYIRENATYHDGTPVTAGDFERAWDRIAASDQEPPSAALYLLSGVRGFEQAPDLGELDGLEVVDDTRFLVRLNRPFASFPAVVSHPALAPVPPAASESTEDYGRMPIGNGPFRMSEPWEPSDFIRLEPYEDYYGQTPVLEQLVYRSYEGDNAAVAGYEDFTNDNLDFAPVPEGRLDEAAAEYGTTDGYTGSGVLDGVRLITSFYAFNTQVAPYNDGRIRRALSLLIDREAIVNEVVPGGRAVADSVVPPNLAGYEPGDCGLCEYNPERAQRFLEGMDPGPFELVYYEGADHEAVAKRVQADVNAALGDGTLTLRPLPQAEWVQAIREGEAGFFLYGWLAEYPSPDTFLFPLFHKSRVGVENVTRYANDDVTDLLNRARRTKDRAARYDLYRQAETAVLQDVPVVPIFHYRMSRVVADRVQDFRIDPMGYVDMTTVRVEPRE